MARQNLAPSIVVNVKAPADLGKVVSEIHTAVARFGHKATILVEVNGEQSKAPASKPKTKAKELEDGSELI